LLELLPQTPRAAWAAVAAHAVAAHAVGEQASALLPSVLLPSVQRILDHPEWRWMFGENSQAEVPLTGLYQGQRVFACVDRLVRFEDRWCVIDFKTGTPHDPIPVAYVEQMRIYHALLSALPNLGARRVEAWILWVDAMQLVPVLF
jgi:ATP-dependent helicase/nuclease subunit A